MYEVQVDEKKCSGAGVCVQQMPSVFRFQPGSKKGYAKEPVQPDAKADALYHVAMQCPSGAIVITKK